MGRWGARVAIVSFGIAVMAAGCHDPDWVRNTPNPPGDLTPPVEEPPPPPPPPPPPDPTPTPTPDGIPGPLPGVYTDLGPADENMVIRGLVSFPLRDPEGLEQTLRELYTPGHPRFRKYLTAQEWMDRHAPTAQDVQTVVDWMKKSNLDVPRVATNRVLVQFVGKVGDFNEAFGATLHILSRKSPQGGNPPHEVFGLLEGIKAPKYITDVIDSVVAADLETDPGPLAGEAGTPSAVCPCNIEGALTPEQVAHAYGLAPLHAQGFRGKGVKLGVTIGAHFRFKDLRAFWKAFGVTRADPIVVQTMEPPGTRYKEGNLDVAWSGVMAPEAELIVYMGPDARNTSMIYTFNEAIARNEVSVITDSFAHREDSEPPAVHRQYGRSASMAAALGITVVAASGDSAGVDTPGSSPYVTAVGGTRLTMDGNRRVAEVAWEHSGSGISKTFQTPWWQEGLPGLGGKRGVVDVALHSDGPGYYTLYLGVWHANYGTSYASPVFAGMMAVVNGARAEQGKPRVGWLNSTLYDDPAVRSTFRDITDAGTWKFDAKPGWDFPTGLGAPDAQKLLQTLP